MDSPGPDIQIVRLIDHRDHVDVVVQWIFDQWGKENNDTRGAIREMLLETHACPPSLIAVSGSDPVGVVAFNRHRLSTKEGESTATDPLDLWVNVLYICEDRRRSQGIGSQLLEQAVDEVRKIGIEERLYVYTDVAGYYQRHGWVIERSDLDGGYVVLSTKLQTDSE